MSNDKGLRVETTVPPGQDFPTEAAYGEYETDPVLVAISELENDAGAVFEANILALLSNTRKSHPAQWSRYRLLIKESGKVSVAELDKLTSSAKLDENPDDNMFPTEAAWPSPVDGAVLLSDIADTIKQYVIADQSTINAAALWITFTWFIDVVTVAPIANITAPEKRCGKTVLLSVLGKLSYRPLTTSNIATAALFRSIQMWNPTLLIDEVDSFLSEKEDARGVLNSGFTRDSAYVIRCTGDDHTPTRFNTWGAKALCGIGKLADTLQDRSIPMVLRRKLVGETTANLRHVDATVFKKLRRKLARFTADNRDTVKRTRPAVIQGLNDRANDCWEPLIAIAQAAGGDWPHHARHAAISIHGVDSESQSIGVELLTDIKTVFEEKRVNQIASVDLITALCADGEAPWAAWRHGKAMTPRQLSARLADYDIKPGTIRTSANCTPKGYRVDQFREAFDRYLPSVTPAFTATPPHACSHGTDSDAGSEATPATPHPNPPRATEQKSVACGGNPGSVAANKTTSEAPQASNHNGCGGVADITHLIECGA